MREQSGTLAHLLRVKRGVKPGDSVAVALPALGILTLALHGIVEAGPRGLPLDTGCPGRSSADDAGGCKAVAAYHHRRTAPR